MIPATWSGGSAAGGGVDVRVLLLGLGELGELGRRRGEVLGGMGVLSKHGAGPASNGLR